MDEPVKLPTPALQQKVATASAHTQQTGQPPSPQAMMAYLLLATRRCNAVYSITPLFGG